MTMVSLSDKARALTQMHKDIEALFAESRLIANAMRDTHLDYTERMTKYSAQQAAALEKIGALQSTIDKIMKSGAYGT